MHYARRADEISWGKVVKSTWPLALMLGGAAIYEVDQRREAQRQAQWMREQIDANWAAHVAEQRRTWLTQLGDGDMRRGMVAAAAGPMGRRDNVRYDRRDL